MYDDKRTIQDTGLLTPKQSTYSPGLISMRLGNTANKPEPDHVNIDKVQALNDYRYQQQLDLGQQQFQQGQQQSATQFQQQQASSANAGKIICAEYHKLGILDDNLNALDQAYGAYLMRTNPKWQKGYLRYARNVVKHLHNKTTGSRILIACLKPFVNVWSQEMGYRMGGAYKHSWLGSFYMWGMVKIFMWLNSARVIGLRTKSAIKKIYKLSIFSKC